MEAGEMQAAISHLKEKLQVSTLYLFKTVQDTANTDFTHPELSAVLKRTLDKYSFAYACNTL